ncbi:cilia- and flagella-associated protein 91-like isoform X2 [Symsagittifera roscoffensis]|uniref:cilia- and flagella-associated protein 91-like isoform X2 n=1 Tax=Symsagittifera roscoffensis TaxID=84072 RepID=UPI00307C71EA
MTEVHTLRKPTLNPTRNYDFLYDPVYQSASQKDHSRDLFRSQTKFDRIKKNPVYPSMFSELRHFPRATITMDPTDPVPRFVSRQWKGYAEQARDALVQYKTLNYDASVNLPPQNYPQVDVGGAERAKFFRRPIIPFMQAVPPEVLLATTTVDPLAPPELQVPRPPTPLKRTVAVQTIYRDGEAQTDPYSPEYVIRPGSAPELLTLATLSYDHGLPAGLAEVEMIERARAKRQWEAQLPQLHGDEKELDKRQRMMDEMERAEWQLREVEIEKLQEARLELLKQMLKEREENHNQLTSKRLDKLWSDKQQTRDAKVKKIRNDYLKNVRRLERKRSGLEGDPERKKDIVDKYIDCGSQVYAPMARFGVFIDRGSEQYNIKSAYLNSYEGLCELEKYLPEFIKNPTVKVPVKNKRGGASSGGGAGGYQKRADRRDAQLADLYDKMKQRKVEKEEKPLAFLQKVEKPVSRPPTPTVVPVSQEEEDAELSTIRLQALIRGRATQNMMREGRDKRIELIRELRSTHALQEAEQSMKQTELEDTLGLQRKRVRHEHKESVIDRYVSDAEGAATGDMMDFLSKELIRLQEERRIHAFSMLAERERRVREAEESGRRQVEERRRREEDEIFKQVMKVHQNSVNSYLEDVILEAVDETAKGRAREEIQAMARNINDIAYEREHTLTNRESQEVVSEMVYGFLLPEVMREAQQKRVHLAQKKHLVAAHKTIHREGESMLKSVSREISLESEKGSKDSGSQADEDPSRSAPVVPEPAEPATSEAPELPTEGETQETTESTE